VTTNTSPNRRRGENQDERIATSIIKGKTKQSKRIPVWLWLAVAKMLGIKRYPKEKPVLAWVLHLATITSATGE